MCMATAQLRTVVRTVEGVRRSAVMAGIVPDARHRKSGGYHVCLVHLKTAGKLGDYSSSRPLDRRPKVTNAGSGCSCAYDIGMSKADMIRTYASVRKVFYDRSDPRRKYVNAINCWRGEGDAQRFNFQTNTVGYATADHKTHVHGDAPRFYVDVFRSRVEAEKAARAHASILIGESRAAWVAREETPPKKGRPPVKRVVWSVRAGDTLFAIAKASSVTVAQLKAWNGLRSDEIFPGQTFRLAAPPPPRPKPVPAVKVPVWPVGARDFFRPRYGAPRYKTVDLWQQVMRAHGWELAVDGQLGPESGRVLTAFQQAEGLKVTRVLDRSTFVRAFTTKKRR